MGLVVQLAALVPSSRVWAAAWTRPQCPYSLVSVACTRSSARCQPSHNTAASRRSDDSLAAT